MASKRAFDSEAAFRKIVGMGEPDVDTKTLNHHSVKDAESSDAEPAVAPDIEVHTSKPIPAPVSRRKPEVKPQAATKYVQKSYYLTPQLIKALKHRAYIDDSLDLSGHVRAALTVYLRRDLTDTEDTD